MTYTMIGLNEVWSCYRKYCIATVIPFPTLFFLGLISYQKYVIFLTISVISLLFLLVLVMVKTKQSIWLGPLYIVIDAIVLFAVIPSIFDLFDRNTEKILSLGNPDQSTLFWGIGQSIIFASALIPIYFLIYLFVTFINRYMQKTKGN